MRVAVDVVPIRPGGQIGGAQHVVCELIKGLSRDFPDDELILLTAAWNHDYFSEYEKSGISRLCVFSDAQDQLGKMKIKSILRKIMKKSCCCKSNKSKSSILKQRNVDILFCPMSAVTYAEPGIPTVSLIHDIQHEYYPQFFSDSELHHRKKFYEYICETADAIICVSKFTRQTFLDKYGFPEKKAFVVHNSIQARIKEFSAKDIKDILKRYELEINQYAFYPANFWPHKNHLILLTAFSMFVRKNPESKLNLVFSGALLDEHNVIRDAVKQMGLGKRVRFLGYITEEELAAVLGSCNFVVFPSLFEGFGIPIVEAMSLGKPVICSNVTSLPEVGGDAALYFDPRQPEDIVRAMEQVLVDSSIKELIKNGSQQVEKFNFTEMVQTYRRILYEVSLEGGGNGYKIQGIFEDGWTGSNLEFMVGKAFEKRVIKIELLCSGPKSNVKVMSRVNKNQVARHKLNPGQSCCISLAVPEEPSLIELSIGPTFNPSNHGSEDTRDLGLQVKTVEILNARTRVLFKKLFQSK